MKKKMMKSTLAVALVAAAAFGGAKTYGAYSATAESDQLLAENVEALSNGGDPKQPETCYKSVTECKGQGLFYCSGCVWLDDTDNYWWSSTDKCNP